MSICGRGMLTRSLPFLPIISPRLMYLPRLLFTLPRTSFLKRWWSRSIFWLISVNPKDFRQRLVNPLSFFLLREDLKKSKFLVKYHVVGGNFSRRRFIGNQ